jgi:hypothetical protein
MILKIKSRRDYAFILVLMGKTSGQRRNKYPWSCSGRTGTHCIMHGCLQSWDYCPVWTLARPIFLSMFNRSCIFRGLVLGNFSRTWQNLWWEEGWGMPLINSSLEYRGRQLAQIGHRLLTKHIFRCHDQRLTEPLQPCQKALNQWFLEDIWQKQHERQSERDNLVTFHQIPHTTSTLGLRGIRDDLWKLWKFHVIYIHSSFPKH